MKLKSSQSSLVKPTSLLASSQSSDPTVPVRKWGLEQNYSKKTMMIVKIVVTIYCTLYILAGVPLIANKAENVIILNN